MALVAMDSFCASLGSTLLSVSELAGDAVQLEGLRGCRYRWLSEAHCAAKHESQASSLGIHLVERNGEGRLKISRGSRLPWLPAFLFQRCGQATSGHGQLRRICSYCYHIGTSEFSAHG
ncbi:hypothetical protein H310_09781 [Aphanomyces invadans]|uniref:Uncharacterized protein n=1 Tax=Aphanomyces invadans TaxID=157072 RepID=A0A024TTJ4_9STRA|nr:hypothetical protein H310_09781 [Aphanomyces invadans]ETV96916.1 hypothetical protein H310_09781 [Aphanomyces invadans]|eukprot:XP_008874162.1 hypothetical protein H310_09781 [Aphanomyces invadans]